jgi:Kef-type K+ transport system membrane component KefB
MAEQLLIALSLILGVAAIITILARIVKQPPIIAYLISGIIVGPIFLNIIGPTSGASEFIDVFARLGVALLLFIVGLNLDFRVLKEFGKVSAFAGIGEIVVTATIGFAVAMLLGFTHTAALYIAIALSFSSTVVVVKILSDKKELDTLHGRIALGILIVEDFVACLILMLLPVMRTGDIGAIFFGMGKIVLLGLLIMLVYKLIVKRSVDYLARNPEVFFLCGIAYALILSALFNYFGLSMEIGALIAGMSLASSKYTLELAGKVKPLRDFFVVLLFVYFGSQLITPISGKIVLDAIIFSAIILLGKPLIVMTFMRMLGYKKRTNFLTGASMAQLSEFSLIVILLGYNAGILDSAIMNLAVLISIITIGISSYSIYYSSSIFNKISHLLNIFDGKTEEKSLTNKDYENYDIVLFGYHRMGYKILSVLKGLKARILVVDYNPRVVLALAQEGMNCVYGDAGDAEFLSEMKLGRAKLVISTIPNEEINITIRNMMQESGSKAAFITTAEQPRIALDLYNHGADYVIIPHHLGGEFIADIIKKFGTEQAKYKNLGKEHKKSLNKAKGSSTFL